MYPASNIASIGSVLIDLTLPTYPRSGSAISAFTILPSAPEIPIALPPILFIEATRDLLISPFNLIKNKGAQKIILVTLIWSLIPVLDKKSLLYTDIFFHGFLQSLIGILFLYLFIRVPKYQNFITSKNSRQIYLVIFLIIISFSATFLQLVALKDNLVPILEVFKRAIGILMALFFGYLFFKEHIGIKKILSIIIIFLGLSFTF